MLSSYSTAPGEWARLLCNWITRRLRCHKKTEKKTITLKCSCYKYEYVVAYIYIHIYIYISSCRAISMDIPDPLSSLLPIVHWFGQILRVTSRIGTELLYVGSSWSSCLFTSMWGGPQEYITYELVPTSPTVSHVSCLSNCDSFHDELPGGITDTCFHFPVGLPRSTGIFSSDPKT